jgi:hypothetical protein
MATIKPKRVQWFGCANCGHQQVRSPQCVKCGAPRDPKNTNWINKWSVATMADVIDAKNTTQCDSCQTVYDKRDETCPYCGEETKGTQFDPPKVLNVPKTPEYTVSQGVTETVEVAHYSAEAASEPTKLTSEPTRLVNPFGPLFTYIGIGVSITLVLMCLWLVLFTGRDQSMTVVRHEWNQYIEVSYTSTSTGECWEGDCPSYDRFVSSDTEDYYSGASIKVDEEFEDCTNCESDYVCGEPDVTIEEACTSYIEDGVEYEECHDVRVEHPNCETIYYDSTVVVSIYGTATPYAREKIYYEIDETLYKNIETGWQVGTDTYFPVYQLNPFNDERFTGVACGSYKIFLEDPDGDLHDYTFACTEQPIWLDIADGTVINTKVNMLGGLLSIDLP